jgi:hypothetical protein
MEVIMTCGISFKLLADLKKPVEALRDAFPQDAQKAAIQTNRAYFETFLENMNFGDCANGTCPSQAKGSDEFLHITADPNNFGFAIKKVNDPDFTGAQIKCAMTERPCTPASNAIGDPNEKVHTISCQANNEDTITFPYTYNELSGVENLSAKTGFLDLQLLSDKAKNLTTITVNIGFFGWLKDLGLKYTIDDAKLLGKMNVYMPGLDIETPKFPMLNDSGKKGSTAIGKKDPDASILKGFMSNTKSVIRQKEVPSEFSNWTYPAIGAATLSTLFCGYKTVQAVQKSLENTTITSIGTSQEEQKTKARQEALIYGAATVASMILGGYAFFNASHCPAGATAHMGKCYTWHIFSNMP